MTRKTKREIERVVDEFDPDGGPGDGPDVPLAYRDPRNGDLYDPDGEPLPPDTRPLAIIEQAVVLPREQAEEEGREILGPADTEADGDHVRTVAEMGPLP